MPQDQMNHHGQSPAGRARHVGDAGAPARTGHLSPGWPSGVLPPAVPGWQDSAVQWCLDNGDPGWRQEGYEALRKHP